MQQWLVIAGLKLVGADQEAVGVFLDLIDDIFRWKSVQAGLGYFGAAELVFAREGDDRAVRALAMR